MFHQCPRALPPPPSQKLSIIDTSCKRMIQVQFWNAKYKELGRHATLSIEITFYYCYYYYYLIQYYVIESTNQWWPSWEKEDSGNWIFSEETRRRAPPKVSICIEERQGGVAQNVYCRHLPIDASNFSQIVGSLGNKMSTKLQKKKYYKV